MGKQNHFNLNKLVSKGCAGRMGLGHWWCWRRRSLPVLGADPSRPLTTNYTSHHAGRPVFYDPQASLAFFFLSRAFLLLKILNYSSPNSYFCLLVFPTRLSHWKPSVNDCLVSCSEERERLMEGADEGREEEQEKPRPGNCTLCNLHCSLLKVNTCKKLFSSCATHCFNLMRSDQF